MRRQRHKLQVSTFPFLAVLLGAMGALILLLLVMDRRSKIVARNKALEIHSQLLAARAKNDATHRQEELARRAEWERKRLEIHNLLLEQEKALAQQRADLDTELAKLNHDLGAEKKSLSALEKDVLEQRTRLDVKNQLLIQMRQGSARTAKLDDASKQEVEKLTRELASLERTLQEAKALRLRKQETYSLVPYRGTRGEGRRPVYIECTADGLVFQPEGKRLDGRDFSTGAFRAEVGRRGIALVREPYDPERPSRPPAPPATTPYVLFLVRPNGLESYYDATSALRGFELDFGYEFVDADWVFDFSKAPRFAAQRGARGEGRGASNNTNGGIGSSGSPGVPRGGGQPALGAPSTAIGATGSTLGANRNNGNVSPGMTDQRGNFGDGGYSQSGIGHGLPGTGFTPRLGPARSGDAANGAGGSSYEPSGGVPHTSESGGHIGGTQSKGQNPTVSQEVSWRGSGPMGATPQAVGPAGGTNPRQGTPGLPGGSAGHAEVSGDGADSRPADPVARLTPPSPFDISRDDSKKDRPPPSLGRLFANRDYVMTIECFANVVALYPSSQVFSAANGPTQDNSDAALVLAVRKLMERRQATVRSGEAPYRPMLRFQVHPDALRTYFHVYPLFEDLHIPMTRENLPS